jgi:radical SAM protein with 4Fe4S-binding SPASM domain
MKMPTWRLSTLLALSRRALRRTINRELNQLAYNAQTLTPFGVPEVFQVELTNHCPMTCVMCPRTTSMTRPLGYMDEELFHRIVREISAYSPKIFLHHFGDSLLHPKLGSFIEHASRHGIKTYLSTNPILLTDARIRALVDSGLHELVISLDGASSETSATIRGKAARDIEEAERRIHALIRYRQDRESETPYLIMQFVRQKLNEHELEAWLAKWRSVDGLDAIKVKSYVTWNGQDDGINALRLTPPSLPAGVVCDKPWTSVVILWDGRVVPCCFDHDGLFDLGSLRTQSLEEIWNGEPARSLRRAHRDANLDEVKLCAKCTDKEGYKVRSPFYPVNRLMTQRTPLADEDTV